MANERFPIRNPAIVLDLGVNGLGIVRSLGRKGVDVTGVVYVDRGVVVHSRYCKVVRVAVGDAGAGDATYLAGFLGLCRSMPAPPVLYAANDLTLAFISDHEEELAAVTLRPPRDRRCWTSEQGPDGAVASAGSAFRRRIPSPHDELGDLIPRLLICTSNNHYDVFLPSKRRTAFHDSDE
jgi:hypothetical protein